MDWLCLDSDKSSLLLFNKYFMCLFPLPSPRARTGKAEGGKVMGVFGSSGCDGNTEVPPLSRSEQQVERVRKCVLEMPTPVSGISRHSLGTVQVC